MKKFLIIFLSLFLFSCGNNSEKIAENPKTETEKVANISENSVNIQKEQEKIHLIKTDFPTLDSISRENFPMPASYTLSGNILINEHQEKIPLLPQEGDVKLATKFIEKNRNILDLEKYLQSEEYSLRFANYFEAKYRAQLAYHIDGFPGPSDVIGIQVHFPAFFTLSEIDQNEFFEKMRKYATIYSRFVWDFQFDRDDIDIEKLQNFYNEFHSLTHDIRRK